VRSGATSGHQVSVTFPLNTFSVATALRESTSFYVLNADIAARYRIFPDWQTSFLWYLERGQLPSLGELGELS
jgi:hypothetical protein